MKTASSVLVALAMALCNATSSAASQNDGLDEEATRTRPRESLRYAGQPFEYWKDALVSDLSDQYRHGAIGALGAFGRHGYAQEALAALRPLTLSDDPQIADAVIRELGNIGRPSIEMLVKLLSDPACQSRGTVLLTLGKFGPDAEPAMPTVLTLLDSTDRRIKHAAIIAMIQIGRPEDQVVDIVRRNVVSLSTESQPERTILQDTYLYAFRTTGLSPKAADDVFIGLMKHEDGEIRAFSARALAWHGHDCAETVSALAEYFQSQLRPNMAMYLSPGLQEKANNELLFKASVQALETLDLSNPDIRNSPVLKSFFTAIELWVGPLAFPTRVNTFVPLSRPLTPASLVVPWLVHFLELRKMGEFGDGDQHCLKALAKFGPEAVVALPLLQRSLADAVGIKDKAKRTVWTRVVEQTVSSIKKEYIPTSLPIPPRE